MTNDDLKALIASIATDDGNYGSSGILIPTRNTQLFHWCLNNGLKLVQQLLLMTVGMLMNLLAPICLQFYIELFIVS